MTETEGGVQSLISVTNWKSRALLPSEVYKSEFIDWAHAHGAFLYLVLIGARTEIYDLALDRHCWKVLTRFHDGTAMKPRTIRVPFDLLPESSTQLVDGVIRWTDAQGRPQRANAVEIARWLLDRTLRADGKLDLWHHWTLRKFFTYRVEYVGQSYGKRGERTSAERIGDGHMQVQRVLSEVADHHPHAAVALIVMDAQVDTRESSFTVGPDNHEELAQHFVQFTTETEGPLIDESKLVTAAEAMLIRSFPGTRNKQYKRFPVQDAPSLVGELLAAGISHLGVQLDVSQSLALVQHPDPDREPSSLLRFAVNLKTGLQETLSSSSPMSWQAN